MEADATMPGVGTQLLFLLLLTTVVTARPAVSSVQVKKSGTFKIVLLSITSFLFLHPRALPKSSLNQREERLVLAIIVSCVIYSVKQLRIQRAIVRIWIGCHLTFAIVSAKTPVY